MDKTLNELVSDARSRISAMRLALWADIESSSAAAGVIERAIDGLIYSMPTADKLHFYETAAKVEERFRPVYDREKVANAKVEGQLEPEQVSTGWWIVLSRFGVAMRFGSSKPDIQPGDTLVMTLSKMPKKPPAPVLAVIPLAPPSPDARAELVKLRANVKPEDVAKVDAVIAALDAIVTA